MKVLVTGGNGFVGATVIEKLLSENYEVVALINQNSESTTLDCQILRADIRNLKSLDSLNISGDFDAVIHSAGLAHQFLERNEQDFWDVNVTGTQNIAELAAKLSVKNFILLSSVAVYGKSSSDGQSIDNKGLDETEECNPQGVYAVTKYESEKVAQKICESHGINLTILRLATVIGENDRGNVFRLIKAIDSRRFIWLGDGRNLKSLIYKGDVAQACSRVLNSTEKPGIYNLSADPLTMKEVVEEIYHRLNRKTPRFSIPAILLNVFFGINQFNNQTWKITRLDKLAKTIQKWLSDDIFSGEKFKTTFDFQIETTIAEALGREVESYRQAK